MYDNMYEIIETAILTGGYDLQAMASKIDAMYAADRLTADEWQKLRKLCLDHLKPDDTRPELQQQLEYLAARVTALEAQVAALTGGASGGEAVYEDWVQPIAGLTDKYQKGAIVRHNGKLWQSAYHGQNVWEPGAVGTESLWTEYTPEE